MQMYLLFPAAEQKSLPVFLGPSLAYTLTWVAVSEACSFGAAVLPFCIDVNLLFANIFTKREAALAEHCNDRRVSEWRHRQSVRTDKHARHRKGVSL